MKVLLFLPSTPLRGFYKPGLFAKKITDVTSLAKEYCKGFPSILQQGGFTHIRIYYGGKGNIPKNWPQNFSARALQFHGQLFQPLPEEKAGQTGSMQTKAFACASLDTDQDTKASFSCFTRAENSNWTREEFTGTNPLWRRTPKSACVS